jgi:hypothetical protein
MVEFRQNNTRKSINSVECCDFFDFYVVPTEIKIIYESVSTSFL